MVLLCRRRNPCGCPVLCRRWRLSWIDHLRHSRNDQILVPETQATPLIFLFSTVRNRQARRRRFRIARKGILCIDSMPSWLANENGQPQLCTKMQSLLLNTALGLAVGDVVGLPRMMRHIEMTITENSFTSARRDENIAAESEMNGLSEEKTVFPK